MFCSELAKQYHSSCPLQQQLAEASVSREWSISLERVTALENEEMDGSPPETTKQISSTLYFRVPGHLVQK